MAQHRGSVIRYEVDQPVVVLGWYGGRVVTDTGGENVLVKTSRYPVPERMRRDLVRAMTPLEKNLWNQV